MTLADGRDGRVGQEGPPISRRHLTGIVERLRRERGYSLDRLAARSMIDREDLDRILSGEAEADLSDIYLLAGALVVDSGRLFDGLRWTPPTAGGTGYEITGGGSDD
jgi:transcriptional regulator with XRE-family HTH domain